MRKLNLSILLIVLACGGFRYSHKDIEPIIYLMPELAEEKAIEHIKEMIKFKGDSILFYAGFGMHHSIDTFLLTINYYNANLSSKSNLYRLIHASNRFVKIDKMNIPIVYVEDYWFSNIVNIKSADGEIGRSIPRGKYYSIIFTGQSYEKGKVIWSGYAH